jgi:hypothetical protein
MGRSQLVEQTAYHLCIARRRVLDRNQTVVVGGISPKYVEAIPARVGRQLHSMVPFDPAVTWHGVMEQMRRVDKIDPTVYAHEAFFSVRAAAPYVRAIVSYAGLW